LPKGTILFVDEIDTFLFDFKPEIIENQLISPVLIVSRFKIIGLTATLRGEQG
jgi:hypothetical protein